MPSPDAIIIPAKEEAMASIIWLHGLGADGHDFAPIVRELNLPIRKIRFIFPHAPKRAVTVNNGMVMRAWYDITGAELCRQEDANGIKASAELIAELISAEIARGIPSQRVIITGFSQGAAIALYGGLHYTRPLGAIVALSGYLPLAETLSTIKNTAQKNTPIAFFHGEYDPVVPMHLAQKSQQLLKEQRYHVHWQQYPMQHGVCSEEIHALSSFLMKSLPFDSQNSSSEEHKKN